MSTTLQRVSSRLGLSSPGNSVHGGSVHGGSAGGSRGNSVHGAGSTHGAGAALALLAGTPSSPRTLVLRACPPPHARFCPRGARGRA